MGLLPECVCVSLCEESVPNQKLPKKESGLNQYQKWKVAKKTLSLSQKKAKRGGERERKKENGVDHRKIVPRSFCHATGMQNPDAW